MLSYPVLMSQAERLFWRDMPARNLSYSVATTNSLMYMYAKLNRPDDALKVCWWRALPLPPRSVLGPCTDQRLLLPPL